MQQIPSGIAGLDAMLKGGLPSSRCVLICGGPGSGKTILCMQFLMYGATQSNEPGLYVSIDESVNQLKDEMRGFGWEIEELEKAGKLAIVDASPIRHLPDKVKVEDSWVGKRNFSMLSLIEVIRERARKIEAKRVVVDPIIALMLQYPSGSVRRTAILDLIEFMSNMGATSLITTELRSVSLERGIRTEEFLAQGVIVLHTFVDNKEIVRGVQIEKMRGIDHDNQIRPYKITESGIEVFAEERPLLGFTKIAVSQFER